MLLLFNLQVISGFRNFDATIIHETFETNSSFHVK